MVVLQGWIIKWAIKINDFSLKYVPLQEAKQSSSSRFSNTTPLCSRSRSNIEDVFTVTVKPFVLMFDRSKTKRRIMKVRKTQEQEVELRWLFVISFSK